MMYSSVEFRRRPQSPNADRRSIVHGDDDENDDDCGEQRRSGGIYDVAKDGNSAIPKGTSGSDPKRQPRDATLPRLTEEV